MGSDLRLPGLADFDQIAQGSVRGGSHLGAPSAELHVVRHALGDVPLVGFFAGGEIAHNHIYGYTGVLTMFAFRP